MDDAMKSNRDQSDHSDEDGDETVDRSTPLLHSTRSSSGSQLDRMLPLTTLTTSPPTSPLPKEKQEEQKEEQRRRRKSWTAVQARRAVDRDRLRSAPDTLSRRTSTSRQLMSDSSSSSKKKREEEEEENQLIRYRFTHYSRSHGLYFSFSLPPFISGFFFFFFCFTCGRVLASGGGCSGR